MKKSLFAFLYVFSIILAIGIGSLAAGGGEGKVGSGGPGCEFSGYTDVNCSPLMSDCTSGTAKGAVYVSDDKGDYKSTGTYSVRGSCSGGAKCTTPLSSDITSTGCAG